jgi:8-oxo-dGTP pyrophosphatase MutT (NUDIX family)
MPTSLPLQRFSVVLPHDGQGKFLLQLRSTSEDFLPGHWCFFGGHLLPGERPVIGAKRKATEELEYALTRPRKVLASTFEHADFRANLHVFTEHCADTSRLSLRNGDDWGWFHPHELQGLKMLNHDRDLVRYTGAWLSAVRERQVAAILLYDVNGRVLLQKRELTRSFLPGYWCFFGGGLDPHETARQAIVREAYEELGYRLSKPECVLTTTFQHPSSRTRLSVFIEAFDSKQALTLHEGQDWGWFSEDAIEDLKMLESDKYLLRYVFEDVRQKLAH